MMRHRRRSGGAALPAFLAALPLLVPAVAIAVRRPVINWTGDRALTELAVREAARLHQLVGMGGRFGWRHPGPLWIQLLVPVYALTGRAPWSLSVGAIGIHVVCVVAAVVVAGRAGGRRASAVVAGVAVAYVALTGSVYWTNLWAGYAFTWPLLALVVVAAVGVAERAAGWALPAAALLATLLVQTDVSTIVPVVLVGVVSIWLRLRRYRLAGFEQRGAIALLAATVLAWVPPIVQEFSGGTGNLTRLWRYGTSGGGSYPVRTALATVGAALSVVPLGSRWVLENGVQAKLGSGPWWAVVWTLAFGTGLIAMAVVARRRRRQFAADLALVTLAATAAAVVAITRVDGPINFYLLTWMTILPVPAFAAAVLTLAPEGRAGWPVTAAIGLAAVVGLATVVTHGTDHNWDKVDALTVSTQTAAIDSAIGAPSRGLVRIHIVTADVWPDAAGVALQLERRGAHIEVDSEWVFLFGDAFRATADHRRPDTPAALDLWFARSHERPALTEGPALLDLGTTRGVGLFARANVTPTPTLL
ncbi:MAG: hypothetical protein ACYDH6_08075 [Acidimicrobiales bacterium]